MSLHRRSIPSSNRRVAIENIRSEIELEKELNRLEKEKAAAIKEIDNETKLFRLSNASPSQNPRNSINSTQKLTLRKSSTDGKTDFQELFIPVGQSYKFSKSSENISTLRDITFQGIASPRIIRRNSSFASSDSSPTSSPESKRRNYNLRHPARKLNGTTPSNGPIPQIVISPDDGTVLTSDVGQERLDVASDMSRESLSITVKRNRSSSVPSIIQTMPSMVVALQHTAPVRCGPTIARPRSNSMMVPRSSFQRGPAKNGSARFSAADRRNSFRRSSIATDHFHGLSRSFDNMGLNQDGCYRGSPPLSPAEWENLKSCRYLRMPNQS